MSTVWPLGSAPERRWMLWPYLQTLTEIGAEQNSTIIFPMPIDIIKPFLDLQERAAKAPRTNGVDRHPIAQAAPPAVA
jgi:hypothetical protein